ncbi:MAG: hypothetical protein KatS3mg057_2208 [Herpetosiphonaceae bacterium]|nr:MAG: hypothetical protein KatS3mg057_2208 [Herpetosiphonaceae bacterium]
MQTTLQPRLTRSSQDRIIAGVAGGLARYFEIDSTLMRLIMVVLFLAGVGLIIYPVLWLIMPRDNRMQAQGIQPGPGARFDPMTGEPLQQNNVVQGIQQSGRLRSPSDRQRFGVVLMGLGTFIMADLMFPWASHLIFPTLLIGAGLVLVGRSRRSL